MKKEANIGGWPKGQTVEASYLKTAIVIDVMGMVKAIPPKQNEESYVFCFRFGLIALTRYLKIPKYVCVVVLTAG